MTGASHADRLHDLAVQFREFLIHQTNVDLVDVTTLGVAQGPEALRTALERLDAALSQLADLQSVYSDSAAGSLDPVAFPVAVLTGEYIRSTVNAEWQEPAGTTPDDNTLLIRLDDGETLDLFPVVRSNLLTGAPNLAAIVRS